MHKTIIYKEGSIHLLSFALKARVQEFTSIFSRQVFGYHCNKDCCIHATVFFLRGRKYISLTIEKTLNKHTTSKDKFKISKIFFFEYCARSGVYINSLEVKNLKYFTKLVDTLFLNLYINKDSRDFLYTWKRSSR